MLGKIEIFLNERMGRDARAARGALFLQAVVPTHDVQREAVAGNVAVGDGVGFSIQRFGLGLFRLIAEQRQQREGEEIARLGNTGLTIAEIGDLRLIASPERFGGSPGGGDLVLHFAGGIKPEVSRLLRMLVLPGNGIEQIGRKDSAFEADGGVVHGSAYPFALRSPLDSGGVASPRRARAK